jgi:hypothetical protein
MGARCTTENTQTSEARGWACFSVGLCLDAQIPGFDRFVCPEILRIAGIDDLTFADDMDIINQFQSQGGVLLNQEDRQTFCL